MVKLLKSGRLPPERLPTVLNLVCQDAAMPTTSRLCMNRRSRPMGFPLPCVGSGLKD